MRPEQSMRKQLVAALRPLHAVSIENGCGVGTPDVNCSLGWIECKQLDEWPARADTKVQVPCYTPQQRVWALMRTRAGGRVWMLLKVGPEWLLYHGEFAAQMFGACTQREMRSYALMATRGLRQEPLIECLSRI